MWVYIQTEPGLYTVGFYNPSGDFITDDDFNCRSKARERVNYLNGGEKEILEQFDVLEEIRKLSPDYKKNLL